jgi:hypothetical protein
VVDGVTIANGSAAEVQAMLSTHQWVFMDDSRRISSSAPASRDWAASKAVVREKVHISSMAVSLEMPKTSKANAPR